MSGPLVGMGERPDGGRQDRAALPIGAVSVGELLVPSDLADAVPGPFPQEALAVGAVVVRTDGGVPEPGAGTADEVEAREHAADVLAGGVERGRVGRDVSQGGRLVPDAPSMGEEIQDGVEDVARAAGCREEDLDAPEVAGAAGARGRGRVARGGGEADEQGVVGGAPGDGGIRAG